jgi:hypothetical protein
VKPRFRNSGADEDNVQYDCNFWNDKGEGDNSTFQAHTFDPALGLNLSGMGANPLEPLRDFIRWDLLLKIDETNPTSPVVSMNITHSCYPAHRVAVNGVTIYEWQPASNAFPDIAPCLLLPSTQIHSSTLKNGQTLMSVPPY